MHCRETVDDLTSIRTAQIDADAGPTQAEAQALQHPHVSCKTQKLNP
jgi:hypothetical protein